MAKKKPEAKPKRLAKSATLDRALPKTCRIMVKHVPVETKAYKIISIRLVRTTG